MSPMGQRLLRLREGFNLAQRPTMIKRAKTDRKNVLYSSPHHIFSERLVVEVLKLDNAIGVMTIDKLAKRSWRQKVPIVLISAFMQTYYYRQYELWAQLAQGVVFNGYDIEFSVDHIHTYQREKSSRKSSSLLIWQTTKRTMDDEFWFIDALCELEYPHELELRIRKFAGESYNYICRIEPSSIMHLFERHCLDAYASTDHIKPDSLGNYTVVENVMLQTIVDDLYFDADSDSFRVRFLELSSLETYLDISLLKNKTEDRVIQRKLGDSMEQLSHEEQFYSPTDSDSGDDDNNISMHDEQHTIRMPPARPSLSQPAQLAAGHPAANPVHHIDPGAAAAAVGNVNGLASESTEDRRPSHSAVVPEMLAQIHRAHQLQRRPPAMDHARTDVEVDALASQVISELDLTSLAEGSTEASSRRLSPIQLAHDDHHSAGLTSLALLDEELSPPPSAPTSPRTATQALRSAEEEIERGDAMVLLLQKMKARTEEMGQRARLAFVAKHSGENPLLQRQPRRVVIAVQNDDGRTGGDNGDGERVKQEQDSQSDGDENVSGGDEDSDLDDGSLDAEGSDHDSNGAAALSDDAAPNHPLKNSEEVPVLERGLSERTTARTLLMKKFRESKFSGIADRADDLQAKLDLVVRQSKALAKKALVQETLKLVDPYGELNERSKVAPQINFQEVQEAIGTKPSIRSRASQKVVIDLLRYGCKLSPYLAQCGKQDLYALSTVAVLKYFAPTERTKEPLHVCGEPILFLYIILEGTVDIVEYATASGSSNRSGDSGSRQAKATTIRTGRARTLHPGDCLGENVLQGEQDWSIDIATPRQAVTLCCLPLDAVLRYVGRKGSDAEGVMMLFWKHHRLWQEIKQHRSDLLRHAKYQQQAKAPSGKMRQSLHFNFQPMNVIESARIKIYQPGMAVFEQGHAREFLHLVLRGCCEYRRAFPAVLVKEGLMPESVEVGLSLMCGDFSFMDGEDHLWLEKMNQHDEKVTNTTEDSDLMREHRKAKYRRFEVHKNALVATSRAEVALVPIAEIAKCMPLFVRLIKLSTERYPAPFVGDEELVRRHYEDVKWQAERGDVLKQVVQDREDRILSEVWHQDIDNNLSDGLFKSKKPGYRVAKLDLSLASATQAAVTARTSVRNDRSSVNSTVNSKNNKASARQEVDEDVRAAMAAAERERCVLQATVDLHTPRRAKMEQYFRSFGRRIGGPPVPQSGSTKSDVWDTAEGSRRVSRARSPSGQYPSPSLPSTGRPGNDVPADEFLQSPPGRSPRPPLWEAKRPFSASAARRSPSPPPPSAPTVHAATPRRPASASAVRRSPRPHSAAEAQQVHKSGHRTSPTSPRPQTCDAQLASPRRPASSSAVGRPRRTEPPHPETTGHNTDIVVQRPATAGSGRASTVPLSIDTRPRTIENSPHVASKSTRSRPAGKLGFVVDEEFLAQFNSNDVTVSGHRDGRHSASPARSVSPPSRRVPELAMRSLSPGIGATRSGKSTPPSLAAESAGKGQHMRSYHSDAAKRQVIDPERYVQVYRERVLADPTQRFLDEFIKKTFL